MNYSNPRREARFADWPSGQHRTECIFIIETTSRGERAVRQTLKANGAWSKPKKTTYSSAARIVDGDDGKTYILSESRLYDFLTVTESNLQYEKETIWPKDGERYRFAKALLVPSMRESAADEKQWAKVTDHIEDGGIVRIF